MTDKKSRRRVKGVYGDRRKAKTQTILIALAILAFIIILVVTGYVRTGSRKNIFTIMAILSVLPFAKYVSILSTLLPYASIPKKKADALMKLAADKTAVFDVIYSADKTVFPIDCAVLEEGRVMVFSPVNDKKAERLKKALKNFFKEQGYSHCAVTCDADYEAYRERIEKAPGSSRKNRKAEMLKEQFLINCV